MECHQDNDTAAFEEDDDAYVVVFDCESDAAFSALPGASNDEKLKFMQFTCMCTLSMPLSLIVHRRATADEIIAASECRTWWRDTTTAADDADADGPIGSFLQLVDKAALVVGYNCLGFDFPLIRRFYGRAGAFNTAEERYIAHRSKTLDLMTRVRDVTGKYFKLDALLKQNGLETKTGDGLLAIRLWTQGRREELESYCKWDVVQTARLALQREIRIPGGGGAVQAPAVGVFPRAPHDCLFVQ